MQTITEQTMESAPVKHPPLAWIVSADMGYGHQRAVYPLREMAYEGVITVGSMQDISPAEKKLWRRMLRVYEFFSRLSSIPVIGKPLFSLLDTLLFIPSMYPIRNLSRPNFQLRRLVAGIKGGLCSGMVEKIRTRHLPVITSFYAPAIAADLAGHDDIYCIICDADLNRVWVAEQPWESRIKYFAPCGKAAQRLRTYGVPDNRIYITGFPLPEELLGGPELPVLKKNLARRLVQLDPKQKFLQRHHKSVEYFLGEEFQSAAANPWLTITYAVGGAGAQKEMALKIANSLLPKIEAGQIKLNLVAGIRHEVREYFTALKEKRFKSSPAVQIIYRDTLDEYFAAFNQIMHETDLLWTKPSELSFYCGLGLPIIMSPAIGSQEQFNKYWLKDITAGIKQLDPDHTDEWLSDYLKKGHLAEAAWSGFLKARKLGIYKIREVLETGAMKQEDSPLLR